MNRKYLETLKNNWLQVLFGTLIFFFPLLIRTRLFNFPIMWDEMDYVRFLQVSPEILSWSIEDIFKYFIRIGFDGHPPFNYLLSFLNWSIFKSILALRVQGAILFSLGGVCLFTLLKRTKSSTFFAFATTSFFIFLWPNLHIAKTTFTDALQPLVICLYFLFRSLNFSKLSSLSAILLVLTRETNIIFLLPYILLDLRDRKAPRPEILALASLLAFLLVSWFFTESLYNFSGSKFIQLENVFNNFISLLTFNHDFYRPKFIFKYLFLILGLLIMVRSYLNKNFLAALMLLTAIIHMMIFSLYDYSIYKPRLVVSGLIPMAYALALLYKDKRDEMISSLLIIFSFLHIKNSYYIDAIERKTIVIREQVTTASKWFDNYEELSSQGIFTEYPFHLYLNTAPYGLVEKPFKVTNKLEGSSFKLYLSILKRTDFQNGKIKCPWDTCHLLESKNFGETSEVLVLYKR
ncbi:hypothetical protein A9Q84_09015 [Halobacteriovorax marinus]|mgnify:CR=1 FL=1|uniref:Uncharacterized protein n=1 Tax=Halobacteriovorax marinus TaxID=97084 RepID=A0A1Y5FBY3_9BACT|nr:hypothetical protein A9Q84_09015 [Halobacteriovorax marinus]